MSNLHWIWVADGALVIAAIALGFWMRSLMKLGRSLDRLSDKLAEHRAAQPIEGLQLDLFTACVRIRQLYAEDDNRHWLLERLFTCDVPRLEGYLTDETKAWAAEMEIDGP